MKQCNIRKITKNGQGTYYISIPKELMKELRFKERQKVVVRKYGKGVLIEDWKEKWKVLKKFLKTKKAARQGFSLVGGFGVLNTRLTRAIL